MEKLQKFVFKKINKIKVGFHVVFRLHADLVAGEKDGDPEGLPVPGVINPLSPGQRQMLIRLINFKSEIKLNDGDRGTETLGDGEKRKVTI